MNAFRGMMGALLCSALACDGGTAGTGESTTTAEPAAIESAPATPSANAAAGADKVRARSSLRCGECHVDIVDGWQGSGHARAATDPIYVAMRADADDASCDSCHAPLAAMLEPDSPIAAEGVTCDVCHSVEKVTIEGGRGHIALDLADNIKRGPLCDSRDHYFHRVACAPMFETAELCSGCHTLERHGTAAIPVHGEYREWLASPFGPEGSDASCQSCHMPTRSGQVAEGWDAHDRYSEHGSLKSGKPSGLRLALSLRASATGITATATVRNEDAGHALPTGLPGRRIALTVRTLDAVGTELGRWEHEYGTRLVDAEGVEVPFYDAVRVDRDDRIAAGAQREHTFELAAPTAARLEVSLVEHALADALATKLGIALPPPRTLASKTIELPPPGPARRRALARPFEVTP